VTTRQIEWAMAWMFVAGVGSGLALAAVLAWIGVW
jgi:hypothetical protein